jgi:hypothetical protein
VVADQDEPLREVGFYAAVCCLAHLAAHAGVAADAHLHGRPPVCHGRDNDAEVLLRHGHPGVEEVFAVVVEGCPDGLGYEDAVDVSVCFKLVVADMTAPNDAPVEVGSKGAHAQELHEGAMLDFPTRMVRGLARGQLGAAVLLCLSRGYGCRRMPLPQPRVWCGVHVGRRLRC